MHKSTAHCSQPSRQNIINWIHTLLPDVPVSFRIEELGKGVVYCRIINYYFPGVILINRIIWQPKTEYQNTLNLRIAQNALNQLKIHVPMDPIKLSKQKLTDNWTFVSGLHRYLTHNQEETHSNTPIEDKPAHSLYHPIIPPNPSNFNLHQSHSGLPTPKRTLDQVYGSDPFYNQMRQPFHQVDSNYHQKSYHNASKYSVGKLYKESSGVSVGGSSPNKGKWSVNSYMFQNNLAPIIDRVKQILLKSSHDTERIRQIKMLLNIPLNEEAVVKVEEDDNNPIMVIKNYKGKDEQLKENKVVESQSSIETKEEIKS